MATVH
jgi:hypothetical protein